MLPPLNRSAVGLALAPLVLAAVGVTHPQDLTPDTAFYWHYMHVALLPVFPLLGVNVWWLLAGVDGPLAWAARVLAFLYVVSMERWTCSRGSQQESSWSGQRLKTRLNSPA